MWELYLITRLNGLVGLFTGLTIVSSIAAVVGGISFCVCKSEGDNTEIAKRIFKYGIIVFSIVCPLLIMTPNTKQGLMIYGIGGTIDYIKQNPTARQLPDKCINALDKWVTGLAEEEEAKESKKQKSDDNGE